jgi:hypothetical protein
MDTLNSAIAQSLWLMPTKGTDTRLYDLNCVNQIGRFADTICLALSQPGNYLLIA